MVTSGRKGHAMIQIHVFFNRICIFDRDLRHHCLKTLPTYAGRLHSSEHGVMIISSTVYIYLQHKQSMQKS
jgi:hypothetical protein